MEDRNKQFTPGKSIVQKLFIRQVFGGCKIPIIKKSFRCFEQCSQQLKIPIENILGLKYALFKKGHVFLGFSSCGKYLYSYHDTLQHVNDDALTFGNYSYTLYWWWFDLWKPLKIVHQVKLFCNENISGELQFLVSEPPDTDYIVVHGSCYTLSRQNKTCYVSIISKPDSSNIPELSVHLHYELLPPHPPFIPYLSLKIPNVLILNCGDILFAVLLDRNKTNVPPSCCYCKLHEKSPVDGIHSMNSTSKGIVAESPLEGREALFKSCSTESSFSSKQNKNRATKLTPDDKNKLVTDITTSNNENESVIRRLTPNNEKETERRSKYPCEFTSCIFQGFTLFADEDSQDSLPSSPFDCTTTVIPCFVTPANGIEQCKLTYDHRCFKKSDKGNCEGSDYYVTQVQFDAENFVNDEAQDNETLAARFISMRDYDMQIVDIFQKERILATHLEKVCSSQRTVIILLNALIVLRDHVVNVNTSTRDSSPTNLTLNLYTIGYLVEWNVVRGHVTILKKSTPVLRRTGSTVKTRRFNPSLSQSVQLYKKWYVPPAKTKSVRTLSNLNVFSGNSVPYLLHPIIPLAVVMTLHNS